MGTDDTKLARCANLGDEGNLAKIRVLVMTLTPVNVSYRPFFDSWWAASDCLDQDDMATILSIRARTRLVPGLVNQGVRLLALLHEDES